VTYQLRVLHTSSSPVVCTFSTAATIGFKTKGWLRCTQLVTSVGTAQAMRPYTLLAHPLLDQFIVLGLPCPEVDFKRGLEPGVRTTKVEVVRGLVRNPAWQRGPT
jgi:hypothetical protein